MNDGSNDSVANVGWAIVQELHRSVPEADRPMSWSDLSFEQERRVSCAAALALRMAIQKEPERQPFIMDRRRMQAISIANEIMRMLKGLIPENVENNIARKLHEKLYSEVFLAGMTIITEEDRVRAGLTPRDQYGLTPEELRIMEARHLEALLSPMPPMLMPSPNCEES